MPEGQVRGVALFPDEGPDVIRLVVEGADGQDERGDRVVWDTKRNAWCEVREPVDEHERRRHRGRPIPGPKLRRQPPQEQSTLPQEVIDRGVAVKAARFAAVDGDAERAREYLEDRVRVGLVSAEVAVQVAERLGLTLDLDDKEG
jgi:hypothetical protein